MLKTSYACLGLCFISYQALAQPQVELNLTQLLDPDCQGNLLVEATHAEPGQCIRYQVSVTNKGTSVAQTVVLKLPIPTHTVLQPGLGSQSLTPVRGSQPNQQLQTQLDRLEAHESLSLHYTVQIL